MDIRNLLHENDLILGEAAIVEPLRRSGKVDLHPSLVHALLIYDEAGQRELSHLYDAYISVAHRAGVPILVCTPTWRANKERLSAARLSQDVNKDAVYFLKRLRAKWTSWQGNILIGGVMGCKNDCYDPAEGLSSQDAYGFHSWQSRKLAEAGVDFLIAETLPSLPEAKGIAHAMSETDTPYFISFVINRNGKILDGNTLECAFNEIDTAPYTPPAGFMINCSHPSFLHADKQPSSVVSRLTGFLANASSLDQSELDGAKTLQVDDIPDWGDQMIELNRAYGVTVLGGCCGTNSRHLQYLVDNANIQEGPREGVKLN